MSELSSTASSREETAPYFGNTGIAFKAGHLPGSTLTPSATPILARSSYNFTRRCIYERTSTVTDHHYNQRRESLTRFLLLSLLPASLPYAFAFTRTHICNYIGTRARGHFVYIHMLHTGVDGDTFVRIYRLAVKTASRFITGASSRSRGGGCEAK